MEPIIKIRQLDVSFGERVILDKIDLDVYPGETLAFIGPSGAGKSTIMKVMTGLLEPVGGSVLLEGQETVGLTQGQWDKLRLEMGVVFQYSALFDWLTVRENIEFGLQQAELKQLDAKHQRPEPSDLLELVGMAGTEDLLPAELSGGMKKRVSLARALAMQPKIIFYDEPTSGLDPIMTMTISRLIKKLQSQFGVTSFLISHDMNSVFEVADRIAVLYKGKIVQVGTPAELRASNIPFVKAFLTGQELEYAGEGEK